MVNWSSVHKAVVTTADPLFDREGWWDPDCRAFASLRRVSGFRFELLCRWLSGRWRGRTVVDLGCGGGLLAVPLAAAGARVVGVDRAPGALRAAHARGERSMLPVIGDLQRSPLASACADVVLLADVLEHVESPAAAVAEAARLLRTGGHLFVNTINRTFRSRLLAIVLGEGLGFIPRGTHEHAAFVRPGELQRMARQSGLELVECVGETPRLWRTVREHSVVLRVSRSLAVGYAALFRRQRRSSVTGIGL